ncbi:Uncharacterized membrane protein [Draconibacterium orientale]|jgi:uncharacterized membrane protein|uniref:Membrane protein n=1 Tax=Draconibacterium orientale TaxID=1168034 RepID=X5DXT6_9BACT|nr:DUF819 family protein [Draconibacterium orientale]AHW60040.1 membrane protein [Draconibacterium orientale]SEU12561.1 Uncharacterized membrane protein [Draconibacterium orientale]
MQETEQVGALIKNDAVVLGLLLALLAAIFYTSNSSKPIFKKFYSVVPMLLLCYFLPSLLTTFNIVDGEHSQLYFMASRYLLPASLVLLTLSINLKEVFKLGSKALIMFLTGTVGVIIGGPLAILAASAINPDLVGGAGPDAVWRGMTTIAGSWIGGGANQAAMYEIFKPSDHLYSIMITVDVLVAEVWMAILLIGVGKSKQIDKHFKADASSVMQLKDHMHEFSQRIARIPSSTDIMVIAAIGLGVTGFAHLVSDWIAPYIEVHAPALNKFSLTSKFFWLIILSTTIGIALSFTKLRNYEGAGASKIGTIFIYILVATIGMKMDVGKIFDNLGLFLVGGIWMAIHVILLLIVGKLIRAPYFFLAVGSKANIGGAASAPVVAAAFHPSLAPVGVLLAVLGYALGTYGAWMCGLLMQVAAH